MTKSIKYSLFLLAAGLVAFASCEKPSPDPESDAKLFADPANCYMVNTPGFYSFKTVKGKTSESVGSVTTAVVLWESFGTDASITKGDIIAETYYKDGLIYFKTPSSLKDGNAVIAAKDASNKILWSWHIWVCKGWDAKATAQKYFDKNNATVAFGPVMDRNLGATSAAINDVRSIGLMYQWGRKDPFLGNDGVSDHKAAASTLIWPDPVMKTAETGTIEFAIAHPTAFIYPGQYPKESVNGDWYYLPGEHNTDDTRWNENKDLYDPCPAGWTLPRIHPTKTEGLWYNALGSEVYFLDWDQSNNGAEFGKILGDATSIWYPFTGHYAFEDGRLHSIASVLIWSSDLPFVEANKEFGLSYCGNVTIQKNIEFSSQYSARAQAFPTRCVAVK